MHKVYLILIFVFGLLEIGPVCAQIPNTNTDTALVNDDLGIIDSANFDPKIDSLTLLNESDTILEQIVPAEIEENIPAEVIFRNRGFLKVENLLFYLFFLMLLIYAFVGWRCPEFWQISRRSLMNTRLAKLFFEEKENQFLLPSILLHLNSTIIIGVLVYWGLQLWGYNNDMAGNQLLLYALLISVSFFAFKYFIQLLLGWVLPLAYTIRFYLYQKLLTQSVLGLVLLPLVILYTFNSAFQNQIILIFGLLVISLASLFLIYKGIMTNLSVIAKYPFHFFLYLCTLEFAPLLIVWKWHF